METTLNIAQHKARFLPLPDSSTYLYMYLVAEYLSSPFVTPGLK